MSCKVCVCLCACVGVRMPICVVHLSGPNFAISELIS